MGVGAWRCVVGVSTCGEPWTLCAAWEPLLMSLPMLGATSPDSSQWKASPARELVPPRL